MPAAPLTIEQILSILPATVLKLQELTAGMTLEQLHAAPEPDAWSVNDVLAHLRACDDVLGGAARRILAEDHRSWRATSPRVWQRRSGYHDWSFSDAFEAFRQQRSELLDALMPLPTAMWERTASVTVPPTTVYERSVHYYCDWLASHERVHVEGLSKIVARVR